VVDLSLEMVKHIVTYILLMLWFHSYISESKQPLDTSFQEKKFSMNHWMTKIVWSKGGNHTLSNVCVFFVLFLFIYLLIDWLIYYIYFCWQVWRQRGIHDILESLCGERGRQHEKLSQENFCKSSVFRIEIGLSFCLYVFMYCLSASCLSLSLVEGWK
jgi:hypothetical protein